VNPGYSAQYGGASYPPSGVGVRQGAYPVDIVFPVQESYNRFWAIPVVGIGIKAIITIPHAILLSILGVLVYLAQFVLWAFVLLGGRYPDWGYALVGGTLRLALRYASFIYGLSDKYPSFSLSDADDGGARLIFNGPLATQRLWAFPILGILIKYLMLIPHLIVLAVLGLFVGVLQYVIWIFVLFTGQYPAWAQSLMGGYLRWGVRVASFLLGLTDAYPPFRLEA